MDVVRDRIECAMTLTKHVLIAVNFALAIATSTILHESSESKTSGWYTIMGFCITHWLMFAVNIVDMIQTYNDLDPLHETAWWVEKCVVAISIMMIGVNAAASIIYFSDLEERTVLRRIMLAEMVFIGSCAVLCVVFILIYIHFFTLHAIHNRTVLNPTPLPVGAMIMVDRQSLPFMAIKIGSARDSVVEIGDVV